MRLPLPSNGFGNRRLIVVGKFFLVIPPPPPPRQGPQVGRAGAFYTAAWVYPLPRPTGRCWKSL